MCQNVGKMNFVNLYVRLRWKALCSEDCLVTSLFTLFDGSIEARRIAMLLERVSIVMLIESKEVCGEQFDFAHHPRFVLVSEYDQFIALVDAFS